MKKIAKKSRGFTLVEMIVGLALSTTILLAGMLLYQKSVQLSELVSQRSVVQENTRTAADSISQDLNQAGDGLPYAGISLPTGAKFGCKTATSCGNFSFALNGTTPTLYGVMPGYALGDAISTANGGNGAATDVISIAYTDREPDLDESGLICATSATNPGFDGYSLTKVTTSPNTITFNTNTCPGVGDPGYGFQVGDFVMISNLHGTILQYVTAVNSSTNTLTFGTDPFNLNATTGTNSLANLFTGSTLPPNASAPATTAAKVNLITYFVSVPNLGSSSQLPPRLYRQVNGLAPQPIAEQIADLHFTYDIIDSSIGNSESNPPVLPLLAQQTSPTTVSNIRKINIQLTGVSGTTSPGVQTQQVPLTTAVSPRGLSFFDQYPNSSSGGTTGF